MMLLLAQDFSAILCVRILHVKHATGPMLIHCLWRLIEIKGLYSALRDTQDP